MNSLTHGANSVWEHTLLDSKGSKGIKKPSPKDPIIPHKQDFIRAKHLNLLFVLKASNDDLNQFCFGKCR